PKPSIAGEATRVTPSRRPRNTRSSRGACRSSSTIATTARRRMLLVQRAFSSTPRSSSPSTERYAERTMRFDTLAVHAGGPAFTIDGAHPTAPPLVPASSYWYDSADELDRVLGDQQPGYSYARYASPTVVAFEEAVAALEGAPAAVAFASGMAA